MADSPTPLSDAQKRRLLRIARDAVFNWVHRTKHLDVTEEDERLHAKQGVFVSLHVGDRLRGCIGTFDSDDPLYDTVVKMAIGAATRDPRFGPMRIAEVPRVEFELSVLTPLRPIAPEDVEPGRHGLLIAYGRKRGTLLPQVATQHGWDREEFIEQTCLKAGLDRTAYQDDKAQLLAFEAEVFSETDMRPTRG